MSIAAMIASMKFNDRRTKREAFDGWTSSDKESEGIKSEPVSEEVLKEIRDKIRKQQRISTIKITVIILICIALFLLFLIPQASELNGNDVTHFFATFK